MPYAGQRVATDPNLIPTGDFLANAQYSGNDFMSTPKQIGANFSSGALYGNCGANNCTGYDTCFLNNRDSAGPYDWRDTGADPVVRMRSAWSGIQLDVYSDQPALQIYSCGGVASKTPLKLKTTQQGGINTNRTIPAHGCVVIEVQEAIDAINNPEWGINQIYGPGDEPYVLQAKYIFSLNETDVGLLGVGSG